MKHSKYYFHGMQYDISEKSSQSSSLLMTLFYRAIFNQLWIMTFNIPITKKDYKHEECCEKVMGVICRILSFIILGSSLLCIGGSQSYSSKNIFNKSSLAFDNARIKIYFERGFVLHYMWDNVFKNGSMKAIFKKFEVLWSP